MKCPKCGYTSFESYDACRKCATDLVAFKESHRITPVVLPASVRSTLAADLLEDQTVSDTADNDNDMFSFNLPTQQGDEAAPVTSPFDFDQAAPSPSAAFSFDTPSATPQAVDDPFASLLESTPSQPAASAPAQGIELNSFSWDETPAPGQGGTADKAKSADDDFNSLFGDIGGDKK